jgi:hypothetical protein
MTFAYLLYQIDRVYRNMATRTSVSAFPPDGPAPELPLEPALARELAIALRSIRYGTIELVIHEGRVVQLERREKVRFEQDHRDGRR